MTNEIHYIGRMLSANSRECVVSALTPQNEIPAFGSMLRIPMGTGQPEIYGVVTDVTLEEDGIARFPDAPTARGVKHVEELIHAVKEGYKGYVLFVVQMPDVKWFEPNDATHKAFGDALRKAKKEGVHVLAATCKLTMDTLELNERINLKLD